jgi:hypothetical protein
MGKSKFDFSKLVLKLTDIVKQVTSLSEKCSEIMPAVDQRLYEVLVHVGNLEYVSKFAFRSFVNYSKYMNDFDKVYKGCLTIEDTYFCGEGLGKLTNEIFLWDFKK